MKDHFYNHLKLLIYLKSKSQVPVIQILILSEKPVKDVDFVDPVTKPKAEAVISELTLEHVRQVSGTETSNY